MHDIDAAELAAIYHADTPTPAGATRLGPWMKSSGPIWIRGFIVDTLRDGRLTIDIGGLQKTTGTYTYSITAADVKDLTPAEARTLAAMLTTAANRIDALTGTAPPF